LVAWQHDGFEMFGQLMDSIDDDYLRYVLHVQAVEEPAAEPDLAQAVYEAADDPVAGTAALAGQLLAEQGIGVAGTERGGGAGLPPLLSDGQGAIFADPAAADGVVGNGGLAGGGLGGGPGGRRRPPPAADPDALAPVVKAAQEKVGRNDPCWCGSGKKFKLCHGAA
ncbi:MAG TPA: SEC-C domain-containing protein, partial [Acidimicrobiales bacterium]|nr:SEC-C domain-containing protein [Acidimicrobiales bacterium]